MLFNDLPLYELVIANEEDGMFVCSLVDEPAIESDFVAFDKDKQLVTLSIENEEQRLVLGAVMIPDRPIFRRFDNGVECYVLYKEDTIKQMVEKFFSNGFQNNTDINHNFEISDGVYLRQAFLKDSNMGISPRGFEELPDNTLFFEYHILNDEVWEKVKSGEVNGFSLAGNFHLVEMKINKKENKEKMKLNKIRTMLQKVLAQFGAISTDKGLLAYESDGELPEVGEIVAIVDEEGNESKPEDGEYGLEDGTVIVVAEGKVSEIRIPEKPVEEPAQEEPVEAEDEEPEAEETPAEEPAQSEPSVSVDEVEALKERIKNLEAEIARLEEENGELKERIAELEKEPAAEPASETFEKVITVEKTGNKKLDRLNSILNAK
jgi:cell division protein FtsB